MQGCRIGRLAGLQLPLRCGMRGREVPRSLPFTRPLAVPNAAAPQESQGDVAAAKAIYEQLVERLRPEEAQGAGAAAAPAAAGDGAQQPAAAAPAVKQEGAAADGQQQAGGDGGSPGAPAAEQQPKGEAAAGAAAQQAAPPAEHVQAAAAGVVALGPEQGTLAWIQYMRFLRRTEGIMAARKVRELCRHACRAWRVLELRLARPATNTTRPPRAANLARHAPAPRAAVPARAQVAGPGLAGLRGQRAHGVAARGQGHDPQEPL